MDTTEFIVNEAREFARVAHLGQVRKYSGAPYIEHPLAVERRIDAITNISTEERVAALLHDVVEDTHFTLADIHARFGPLVAKYVDELTDHYPKMSSPGFNRAARKTMELERLRLCSRPARQIKLADLLDNLNSMSPRDGFSEVFLREAELLAPAIRDGTDPCLRDEVIAALGKLRQKIYGPDEDEPQRLKDASDLSKM